ncbi:galactose metabolism-related protein [Marasmius tenuissimus]|uniref:Galactose metabolism-related protein n=1 Tax=Marasmius tenuissimus TaxID=585030 RepID=A0ABR2ZBX3_9AGAR
MPLPNIPPAPRLPRILEKLILNQQTNGRTTAAPAGGSAPLAGASLASPGGMASIARRIGGIPTGNREREGRERERVRSPVRTSVEKRRERERDKRTLGMTPTSTPAEEKKESDVELKVTTASGTDVTTRTGERATSPRERERDRDRERERDRDRDREGRPMSPPSRDRDSMASRHPHVVDNRTIADDSSVLPVPSHVVIHHLCTSAIKNGVLGVGGGEGCKKCMSSVIAEPTKAERGGRGRYCDLGYGRGGRERGYRLRAKFIRIAMGRTGPAIAG